MQIPFAEWLPDLPALNNPGATVAKNVIPHANSYLPVPSVQQAGGQLDGACLGAFSVQDKDAVTYNFAADATKIYSLSSGAYSDVSSATYTTSNNRWSFIKWGEKVIATNYNDAPQIITLGDANFANLAGSPPKSRAIAVVRDFVVMGNVDDGTVRTNRVQWSGINNEATWTPNVATQSDYQDLQGNGGWIQAIVGGEYGVIFQERSIWRMTYVGSPVIFQFDEIETGRGTPAPYSVINIGAMVFYLGIDGFYMFDGNTSKPISANKTSKTFYGDLDEDYVRDIVAVIDPVNTIVQWLYHGQGHTGTANKIISYNWTNGRWSEIEQELEHLTSSRAAAFTLEQLDSVSTDIDAMTLSFDSRFYKGGSLSVAGFDSSHNLVTFSGDAMPAEVETAEFQMYQGKRSLLKEVMPLVDCDSSVRIGARKSQKDPIYYSPTRTTNTNGKAFPRVNNRYHRVNVATSDDFTHLQGVEVSGSPTGGR